MNRDHLLGWPAALLALDPEPRVSQRTLSMPRMSEAEQAQRRADDKNLTLKHAARQGSPAVPKPAFVPQYFRGDSGTLYRTTDAGPHRLGQRFHDGVWKPCISASNQRLIDGACYQPTTRPPGDPRMNDFDRFNAEMRASLAIALKWGDGKLYTSADTKHFDQVYLDGFLSPADRQHHNCNACRHFLRRYGSLLVTNGTEVRSAMFGFHNTVVPHFERSRQLMVNVLGKVKISGVFASELTTLGQPETNGWTHFWATNPSVYTGVTKTARQTMAQHRQDFLTLRRGLAEYSLNTFSQVTNLMSSDATHRASKFEDLAKTYFDLKVKISALDQSRRDVVLWQAVAKDVPAGIKGSALGSLYDDVEKNMDLAEALRRFTAVVDPRKYMQPTAAPKAGNIKRAEDVFAAMGLAPALERRVATFDEVRKRCAWLATSWVRGNVPVPGPAAAPARGGIFGALAQKVADPAQAAGSRMSLRKFMEQRSQSIDAMQIIGLDRPHSLGAITGAVHNDAPPLFAWNHPYGWYRWFGVAGKDFGLGSTADVLGVLDLPSTWFGQDSPHKGLMFVLRGANDQGSVGSGIPAEGLRSELHEVKRTIVAHALNGKLTGQPGEQAAGLIVRKDDFKPFVIRTLSGSLTVDHTITSWE